MQRKLQQRTNDLELATAAAAALVAENYVPVGAASMSPFGRVLPRPARIPRQAAAARNSAGEREEGSGCTVYCARGGCQADKGRRARHSGAPILRRYAAASALFCSMAHSECSVAVAATQGVSGRLRARQGLRHLFLAATSAFDATSRWQTSTWPIDCRAMQGGLAIPEDEQKNQREKTEHRVHKTTIRGNHLSLALTSAPLCSSRRQI